MSKSKALIGIAVCVALAGTAKAEPINLLVGGLAYHLASQTYEWNGETHTIDYAMPMIGIEWNQYTLAAFRNTYGKNSIAFAKSWYWGITDNLSFETKAGTVTGYGDTPVGMEVAPLVSVGLDYKVGKYHTVVSYIPPVQSSEAGVVTLHFKYEF